MMNARPKSVLFIKGFTLNVNLGWRKEERKAEQPVLMDLDIHFPAPPKACETDALKDTCCYAELTQTLREYVCQKHFSLVEHLALAIYEKARLYLPEPARIVVRITKYPKIEGSTGGVCFQYGDDA